MCLGRISHPTQHPGDLGNPLLSLNGGECGFGATILHRLDHHELGGGRRGDLRQVGDAEHLMTGAEFAHLGGNTGRYLPADVRIDLVKDQKRDPVLIGKRRLERKHDAGYLAA